MTTTTTNRNTNAILWIVAIVVLIGALVYFYDFRANGNLRMPQVSGGETPNVTVEGPKVTVGEKPETVTVPTGVKVETEKRTLNVPAVDVQRPADQKSNVDVQKQ